MSQIKFSLLDLQLFSDGVGAGAADGGTGAEGNQADNGTLAMSARGVKNPLANVRYGKQTEAQPADVQNIAAETVEKPDRNAEFEKLIKGEYKDLYDARVQDTIQKRLKGTKDTVDRYNALLPTLEMLANKYGMDANSLDVEALNKAIDEDDAFFEQEALEKGVSVDQLKQIRKMERENSDLKRQMREQSVRENADRIYAGWMEQSESLKQVYPNFELNAEMRNPKFVDLLKSNVDVRTAYEVVHKDEIIQGAMQFTADTVGRKLTNKVMAQGMRPTENGTASQASAVVKSDVSQLSKADREEINRRVARGERITF